MELAGIIKQRICDEGPINFQQFMEMALYYPGLGYYMAGHRQIGKDGDFYTSPSITNAFGALIGKQLEEMWHFLGEEAFTIVEYGAGTGSLCHDILEHLQGNNKMYDQLRYCIIEKSPTMRRIEKSHLSEKVYWYDCIEEIGTINGCVLSNELVDNFPVRQVVMEKEPMEVFVGYRDGFTEILRPAPQELKHYLEELGIVLPENFRTEINLHAINWIKDVAAALKRGYVLTIDYGHQSAELYKPHRSQGTLLCYHKHSINDAAYHKVGAQDITSHVNFSSLSHWGAKNGLSECGLTDQCHFLLALGFKEFINKMMSQEKDVFAAARKASLLSNILLMEMGTTIKVLIQAKGACEKRLLGLSSLNYPTG